MEPAQGWLAVRINTWNQKLEAHARVHAVVPGGGPALVGGRWKQTIAPASRPRGGYLVGAITLRRTFRERESSYLQIAEQQEALLTELQSVEWVSYIEPPPHADCRPEQVLKYLTRYLTGGPISDSRIVSPMIIK